MKKIAQLLLILIAFILLAILTSCITEKKRAEICKTCPVEITQVDSSWVKTKIIHDSEYIFMAGPIRYIEDPCSKFCDSLGKLKVFEIKTKKNGISQSLKSSGNIIIQDCNLDSLLRVNEQLQTEIHNSKSRIVYKFVEKNVIKGWQNFLMWVGGILSFSIILYIIVAIVSRVMKIKKRLKV